MLKPVVSHDILGFCVVISIIVLKMVVLVGGNDPIPLLVPRVMVVENELVPRVELLSCLVEPVVLPRTSFVVSAVLLPSRMVAVVVINMAALDEGAMPEGDLVVTKTTVEVILIVPPVVEAISLERETDEVELELSTTTTRVEDNVVSEKTLVELDILVKVSSTVEVELAVLLLSRMVPVVVVNMAALEEGAVPEADLVVPEPTIVSLVVEAISLERETDKVELDNVVSEKTLAELDILVKVSSSVDEVELRVVTP